MRTCALASVFGPEAGIGIVVGGAGGGERRLSSVQRVELLQNLNQYSSCIKLRPGDCKSCGHVTGTKKRWPQTQTVTLVANEYSLCPVAAMT